MYSRNMFYGYQPPPPPPPPPPSQQQQQRQIFSGHQNQSYQFNGQGSIQQQQQYQQLTPSAKPMKCLSCDTWCGTYELWLGHLTSEVHQKRVATSTEFGHESWREESLRSKCLTVSGVRGLGIGQVVTYLAKWGTILDIIRQHDKATEGYFVLYEAEESVLKILQAQTRTPHSIQGRHVFFRRKYETARSNFPNLAISARPAVHSEMISRDPKRLQAPAMPPRPPRPPAKSALSLVSSSYSSDKSEGNGLGFLQSTYDEDEEEEGGASGKPEVVDLVNSSKDAEEIVEDHDLFSVKMTEHLAKTLGKLKLEDQVEGFTDHILLSPPFLAARFKMIQELQLLLQKQYPKCTIYACGPDYIGIGCSDDPVVVFVDLFDKYGSESKEASAANPWERSKKDQLIPEVFKILKNEQDNSRYCSNLIVKPSQSCEGVQVLTFTHVKSQVKCCIRTEGFQIVQESMLIKFLCTLDPRVRPLLILVRYWCSFHKILNGQQEIRNRLVVLLMLFHLANKNVIPTVSFLQSLDHKKVVINNYDMSFSNDPSKIPQDEMKKYMNDKSVFILSVLSVLKEFFERFALASYKELCVCLWPAKFIMRKDLEPGQEEKIPDDFALKLRFGANGDVLQNSIDNSTPMCVQDFFDMSLNVAKAVVAEDLRQFQLKCWESCEKLEKILNSPKQYLLDLFVNTQELLDQMEKEEEEDNEVSIQEIAPSRWEKEDRPKERTPSVAPPPARQLPNEDMMNLEWEDFSKSLESEYQTENRITSTPRRKPVAPVKGTPSLKQVNESFNAWYEDSSRASNRSSSFNYSATSSTHLARPPLRYDAQQPGPSTRPSAVSFADTRMELHTANKRMHSSSDDSSESESDEEEEEILMQPSPLSRAAMVMPKITFPTSTKLFFIKAVENSDFLYGIQGKIQALYLNFMKDFSYKFFGKCLGFSLDLDPPHQDTNVADYAKLNSSNDLTLSAKMDTVPLFEESLTIGFFCQSRYQMNKLMNIRDCDLMNKKFLRKQVKPMLRLMLDNRDQLLKPGYCKLISTNSIRFRCTIKVELDYEDLNRGFAPYTVVTFEDVGTQGGAGWPRLQFFGRLFSRMAPRYVLYCYKQWLCACSDFDRRMLPDDRIEKKNRDRLMRSDGGMRKKKDIRETESRLHEIEEARKRLQQSEMEIARRQQELQLQQVSRVSRLGSSYGTTSSAPAASTSSRPFQVPPSWNRSIEYDNQSVQNSYNQRRF